MKARLPAPPRQSGAALLLLAVLLALASTAYFLSRYSSDGAAARTIRTEDSLARAKAALIGYAASYREQVNPDRAWGYLPCPDTDNDGTSNTDFAQCPSAPGQNVIGRLPFITLGLPDMRDESGECLWYVVSGTHKTSNSTSAINWDLRGNLRIVDADGSVLSAPDDAEGGAVAAIIAPGPPLGSQDRSGTSTGRCPGGTSNAIASYLDGSAYTSPTGSPLELKAGNPGSPTNNDRIVWITAKELFAPPGRRSDLLGSMLGRLQGCMNSQFALPRPASSGNMTRNDSSDPKWQVAAAGLDEILNSGTLSPACSWGSAFTADLWKHWKDHVRYVLCDNGSACLTIGASACTGALLFAGRNLSGAPRATADKTIAGYFEDPNRASLNGTGTAFGGGSAYAPDDAARDIALCLNPASSASLSFANDFGTLTDVRYGSFGVNGDKTITLTSDPDPTKNTLTLGDRDLNTGDAPAAQLFGCSWFGSSLPFGKTLRAYFQYTLVENGNGFVFVIADAPSDGSIPPRNPSPTMCGSGAFGRMGYAGTAPKPDGSFFPPINHPKIGLEVDTNNNTRDQPEPDDDHHAGFVFWGDPADENDDNQHGAGAGTPASPRNPTVLPGLGSANFIRDKNGTRHVRLEIQRSAKSGDARSYTLTAWILKKTLPAGFADLATDFTASEESAIPDPDDDLLKIGPLSVTIADLAPGSDALKHIWIGFTTSSTIEQEVRITDFIIRTENE